MNFYKFGSWHPLYPFRYRGMIMQVYLNIPHTYRKSMTCNVWLLWHTYKIRKWLHVFLHDWITCTHFGILIIWLKSEYSKMNLINTELKSHIQMIRQKIQDWLTQLRICRNTRKFDFTGTHSKGSEIASILAGRYTKIPWTWNFPYEILGILLFHTESWAF